jgi:hypothetical protein
MDPLLLIATQLLPDFVRLFAGDQSGSVSEQVVEAIKKATGTDDSKKAQETIEANPQIKAQLQKDLAEIALEETKERNRARENALKIDLELQRLEAEEREHAREAEYRQYLRVLQDRRDVRARQASLAENDSPLAWVAPILAFSLVAMIFYLLRGILVAREPVLDKDVFNVVLGGLVTAFTTVVSFYFGSSLGSRHKDHAVATGKLTAANPITAESDRSSGAPPAPATDLDKKTPQLNVGEGGVKTRPKAPPVPSGPFGLFRQKAPGVMRDLVKDLGLADFQAAGVLGNIGHECAGFQLLQEQRPLRGGRGGWGWCQWTGPRRRAFEKWASEKNLDFSGYDANYGFLLVELQGSEAASLRRLRETLSLEEATMNFMKNFERPGIENLPSRVKLAQIALTEYKGAYNG